MTTVEGWGVVQEVWVQFKGQGRESLGSSLPVKGWSGDGSSRASRTRQGWWSHRGILAHVQWFAVTFNWCFSWTSKWDYLLVLQTFCWFFPSEFQISVLELRTLISKFVLLKLTLQKLSGLERAVQPMPELHLLLPWGAKGEDLVILLTLVPLELLHYQVPRGKRRRWRASDQWEVDFGCTCQCRDSKVRVIRTHLLEDSLQSIWVVVISATFEMFYQVFERDWLLEVRIVAIFQELWEGNICLWAWARGVCQVTLGTLWLVSQ